MYLLIQYPGGVIVEGVVLAKGKNRLRVAAPGFADTLELQRSGQNWSIGGEAVEIEFLMSAAGQAEPEVRPMVLAHAN